MKRDAQQADTLLREHGSKLILFAQQHVNRHADAEDVVQEAFARYWRQRGHVRDPLAYLYRCVRTAAIDLRRRRQLQTRDEAWRPNDSMFAAADEHAMSADRQRVIADALATLSSEHREIVTLRIWSDLTFDQIAETLDLAKSTAFSQYNAAMKQLRQHLETVPV